MRKDVTIGPVTTALRQQLLKNRWLEDDETNALMGYGRGLDGSVMAKQTFAQALERVGSSGALGVYRAGEPVGYVLLKESSPLRRTVRFQMFLDPSLRGTGIGPAALAQLADRVLLDTKAHRLETEILATNAAAKKWLKHEGFTQESFRKHSWWKDGSPRSTVVLRLLAPDWRRIRKERQAPRVKEVA